MSEQKQPTISEILAPFHLTGCPFSEKYGSCSNGYCAQARKQAVSDIEAYYKESHA